MRPAVRNFCLAAALLSALNMLVTIFLLRRPTTTDHVVHTCEPATTRAPLVPPASPPRIQSVHLTDFAYRHWPAACTERDPQPLLLGAVVSAQSELDTRRLLRRLYMSAREHRGFALRWLFVLAGGPNATLQAAIDREAARFGDIVQLSFQDSYENLTLKTLAAIDWATAACPGAEFFFKTDTDCMVNPFRLVHFLMSLRLSEARNLYAGYVPYILKPIRSGNMQKWHISYRNYPLVKFPPYAIGGGYLLSRAALLKVMRVSDTVFPVRLEDVYVGMCASRVGLTPSHQPKAFIMLPTNHSDWCSFHTGIVVNSVDQADMPSMWHHMTAPVDHNPDCDSSARATTVKPPAARTGHQAAAARLMSNRALISY